jgi:hypothetical protein
MHCAGRGAGVKANLQTQLLGYLGPPLQCFAWDGERVLNALPGIRLHRDPRSTAP